MDTLTTRSAEDVQRGLATIKNRMPNTYEYINAQAKEREVFVDGKVASEVYALVKRGLRGEANCFWAMEAGYVVGTPFDGAFGGDIHQLMIDVGSCYTCALRQPVKLLEAHS